MEEQSRRAQARSQLGIGRVMECRTVADCSRTVCRGGPVRQAHLSGHGRGWDGRSRCGQLRRGARRRGGVDGRAAGVRVGEGGRAGAWTGPALAYNQNECGISSAISPSMVATGAGGRRPTARTVERLPVTPRAGSMRSVSLS